MAIGLALGIGAKLFQGITGAIQKQRGQNILNRLQRPTYKTPDKIHGIEQLAKMQASADMPGYDNAKGNINTSAANAADLARESGNPLAAIASIQGQQDNANRNLAVDNASYRDSKITGLQSAMKMTADYKDKEWQMNKFAPYKDKYNEAREMIGAGGQNMYGAMDGIASIVMAAKMAKGTTPAPSIDPTGATSNSFSLGTGASTVGQKTLTPPMSNVGLMGRMINWGSGYK